jgi:hypothetical protein
MLEDNSNVDWWAEGIKGYDISISKEEESDKIQGILSDDIVQPSVKGKNDAMSLELQKLETPDQKLALRRDLKRASGKRYRERKNAERIKGLNIRVKSDKEIATENARQIKYRAENKDKIKAAGAKRRAKALESKRKAGNAMEGEGKQSDKEDKSAEQIATEKARQIKYRAKNKDKIKAAGAKRRAKALESKRKAGNAMEGEGKQSDKEDKSAEQIATGISYVLR